MPRTQNRLVTRSEPAPEGMGSIAKEHWNDLIGRLAGDGVVRYIDLPIIRMACDVYERYIRSLKDGDFALMSNSIKLYIQIMEKFGATEKARQSIKLQCEKVAGKSKKKSSDEEGDFFDD